MRKVKLLLAIILAVSTAAMGVAAAFAGETKALTGVETPSGQGAAEGADMPGSLDQPQGNENPGGDARPTEDGDPEAEGHEADKTAASGDSPTQSETLAALTAEEIKALEEKGAVDPGEIIVVMKKGVNEQKVIEKASEATPGDDIAESSIPLTSSEKAIVIETESDLASAIEAYESHPDVEYAQPNYVYTLLESADPAAMANDRGNASVEPFAAPNDDYYSLQWALKPGVVSRVSEAWDFLGVPKQKVRVAVIDTGIAMNHPDLGSISSGGNVNFSLGYDAYLKSQGEFADDNSHGTHVAGIIAATSNNGLGVAGVSYNRAEIVPIRVFYDDPKEGLSSSTTILLEALNYASGKGCRVANMSLGGYGDYDPALQQVINEVTKKGMLVIAAAGNENTSEYTTPSDMDNVLSVVATDSANNGTRRWYQSSEMGSNFGQMKDIAAPGSGIYSTAPTATYQSKTGTSMSAPYVAGIAAMVFSENPSLSPAQLSEILTFTAVDAGAAGRDDYYGNGVVDAKSALIFAGGFPKTNASFVSNGTNPLNGKITVSSQDLVDIPALSGLKVAVWGAAGGQNDLKWYSSYKSGGSYTLDVPLSSHGESGAYNIHIYGNKAGGGELFMKALTVNVQGSSMAVSAALNSANTVITARIENAVVQGSAIRQVRFAIWGEAGGQNDLVWRTANSLGGGSYSFSEAVSNHREAGRYQIHVYADLQSGGSVFVGAATVTVAASTATIAASAVNSQTGTFKLTASDISSPSGIKSMRIAVWSRPDQSDLYWYPAQASGSNFTVDANIARHRYNYGTYYAHAYATAGNGIDAFAGATVVSIQAPTPSISAQLTNGERTISINGSGIIRAPGVRQVRFAVWGEAGGQNDLVWRTANSAGNGTYTFGEAVSSHRESGRYQIHTYAELTNGSSVFVGAASVTVSTPGIGAVTVSDVNSQAGTFKLTASDISAPSGVSSLRVAVWSRPDQSDIYWYPAQLAGNTFTVNANISRHRYNYGTYHAHAYATAGNGVDAFVGAATVNIQAPAVTINAVLTSDEKTINIKGSGIVRAPGVRQVRFAVWGEAGGQNDLVWRTANSSGGGSYSLGEAVSGHREAGRYQIHAYAELTNGSTVFVGAATVTVAAPEASVTVSAVNGAAAGQYRVVITPEPSTVPSGVTGISVPTWSNVDGQDDIVWYTAKRMPGSDSYYVDLMKANHKRNTGIYHSHVYLSTGNGYYGFVGAVSYQVS
ncbi:MAG: GBS Bsp-like repeat-containing protein [Clostridiales Family XIII bacterium]|nr:GBS Bsp-like repeat-containing protein [Clostridiales Family XIII bacterium]